ncbi:hypothetical protein [Maribacter sp. 4G9]|uniref:hypothetical protein n=1 Tax=Maribacter sp. 4G9 TaxID=1889777 RepID=UPI000C15B6B7|nr:hypothetical protein [Maribacter sp. 4G9]PIB30619.1 hypothetical protein BFP75_02485 [Maribacter sp. 4G9]
MFSYYHRILTLQLILLFSTAGIAQKAPVKLFYQDGSSITGEGKLKKDQVKFWKSDGSKAEKIDITSLERVTFRYRAGDKTYLPVEVREREYPLVLQLLEEGSVSLYRDYMTVMYMSGMGMPGSAPVMNSNSIVDYYVRREGQPAEHLASNQLFSKNFKKAASQYFEDCPELVQRIQNHEYQKRDIQEVVSYYNSSCND